MIVRYEFRIVKSIISIIVTLHFYHHHVIQIVSSFHHPSFLSRARRRQFSIPCQSWRLATPVAPDWPSSSWKLSALRVSRLAWPEPPPGTESDPWEITIGSKCGLARTMVVAIMNATVRMTTMTTTATAT